MHTDCYVLHAVLQAAHLLKHTTNIEQMLISDVFMKNFGKGSDPNYLHHIYIKKKTKKHLRSTCAIIEPTDSKHHTFVEHSNHCAANY